MRILKHRSINSFPSVDEIKDEATKTFGKDLADVLIKALRNIYDDEIALQNADRVDSLPTASAELRGRMFLVDGTGGAADILHICRYSGAAYEFKTVTVS